MCRFFIIGFVVSLQAVCFGKYYSQCGQDKFVNEHFFKNMRSGIFIDIGAHSGIEISNTYFFETELGWDGICIEPIPELFEKLKMNRKCYCIQGCISDTEGVAEFIRFPEGNDWFSGLKEKYKTDHLKVLKENYNFPDYELINVRCYLLDKVLEEYGVSHINFLSIDTEGGEYDILTSIDFSKYSIDVIAVEDNHDDKRFRQFLKEKGFKFVRRLDQDLIFVSRKFLAQS